MTSAPARDFSVLVVDGSSTVRRTIRLLLEGEPGVQVLPDATSGAEALLMFFQHRPDVVLLDICLPDTNGFDVLEQIRCVAQASAVIMLSNSGDGLVRQACHLLGATEVCHKSAELTHVPHLIRRLRREGRKQRRPGIPAEAGAWPRALGRPASADLTPQRTPKLNVL